MLGTAISSSVVLVSGLYQGTVSLGDLTLPATYQAAGYEVDLTNLVPDITITLIIEESFDNGQTWFENKVPTGPSSDPTKILGGYLAFPGDKTNYLVRGHLEIVGGSIVTSVTAKVF